MNMLARSVQWAVHIVSLVFVGLKQNNSSQELKHKLNTILLSPDELVRWGMGDKTCRRQNEGSVKGIHRLEDGYLTNVQFPDVYCLIPATLLPFSRCSSN